MKPTYMTDEQIRVVAEAIYHIHSRAVEKATETSYQTAYDELQGVWIVLHYMYESLPYLSLSINSIQHMLALGMYDEKYRNKAKETWIVLHTNKE